MQELQTMNIQMRIITEDNIDQLMNMSYSDNINKLLKIDDNKIGVAISGYLQSIQKNQQQPTRQRLPTPSPEFAPEHASDDSVPYASASPAYVPNTPPYIPTSPAYNPNDSPQYDPNSPQYDPNSPQYDPRTPEDTPPYAPSSPDFPPPNRFTPHSPEEPPPPIQGIKIKNAEVKAQFDALSERDKIMLMKMIAENKANKDKQVNEEPVAKNPLSLKKPESSSSEVTSILKVPEEKKSDDDDSSSTSEKKGGEIKSVSFSADSESSSSSSGETKQIKI